jgi:hypothetical protein
MLKGSNGARAKRSINSSLKAAAIIGSKKGWFTAARGMNYRSQAFHREHLIGSAPR